MENNKLALIVFGPPGAGKGTQAGLLSEKLGLYHLEPSRIIENEIKGKGAQDFIVIKGKKYFYKDQERFWQTGALCDPPFVTYLIKERIRELFKTGENLITSGSPRTLYEGEEIIPLLKKLYGKENIKVILLKLSAEESIYRNSHRKICELMRHPVLHNKETIKLTICPLDGSKLQKRKGLDDPETIKIRLKEYQEKTLPVINYFKKEGLKIREVNGEQSVAEVFKDILRAIK